MFYHRGGSVGAGIAHGNVTFFGSDKVDIVGAGCRDTDQGQGVGRMQDIPVDRYLVGNDDVGVLDGLQYLARTGLFVKRPVIQ